MSDKGQSLETQIAEMVGSIKELTVEIKNLVKSHDETRDDVKDIEKRVRDIESKIPLFESMKKNQEMIKMAFWTMIFTLLAGLIAGGMFYNAGG